MTLEQALEIVKDHIRVGKGMGANYRIPEALEMVVEELQQYKERAEIYALMLETSFTEQEIEDAYEKAIEVYRQAKEV